jgi:hypothetical protein
MAITKIGTPELFDFSSLNTALQLPTGDTASRPSAPSTGEWRYNTTLKYVEYYDGGIWRQIDTEELPNPANFPSENFNVSTYYGNATARTLDAKFNEAANFNGASSGSQIFISDADVFSPANNDLSFSVWINTTSTNVGYIASKQNDGVATYEWQFYMNTNGTVAIGVFTSAGSTIAVATSTATVNDGNWHNVAFVIDTNTSVTVYVDKAGVTNSSWSGTMSNTSTDVGIGYGGENMSGNRLEGALDQARFFNTALSSSQIDSLYDSETTTTAATLDFPSGAGCFAAYPFDGDASDLSGTYGGVTTSVNYTGLRFQPDFVWTKNRGLAEPHMLYDSVRGVEQTLYSNTTDGEYNDSGSLTSFDSNGFSLGTYTGTNRDGYDFVAWCFKGGGAPTTDNVAGAGNVPTAGSFKIDGADSTTAAAGTLAAKRQTVNTEAGFSIVKYDGGTGTLPHGLGVTPSLLIQRNISGGTWYVYLPPGVLDSNYNYLELNNTGTGGTTGATPPTSTTFNPVSSSGTYIAYIFANISGYQKVGTYSGTANDNGNYIYTDSNGDGTGTDGFEPAFLLVKRTDTAAAWFIYDNKRIFTSEAPRNPLTGEIRPNENFAEDNYPGFNFYSNGFEVANNGTNMNASGGTYLYLAIAADKNTSVPTAANSFSATTYTSNNGTAFNLYLPLSSDFSWLKNYDNNSWSHLLMDTVRAFTAPYGSAPNTNIISSDSTNAQFDRNSITSFNPNGLSIGTYGGSNDSTNGIISWNWKAGGTAALNVAGDIKSVVNVNQNAGFSIVKYNGASNATTDSDNNGGAGWNIGHSLGVAPSMIIVKKLLAGGTSGVGGWYVGADGITTNPWTTGNGQQIVLNSTDGVASPGGSTKIWNSAPTATTFNVGGWDVVNRNGGTYVAYCFANISGYVKVSTYQANSGSAKTIYTTDDGTSGGSNGFQPSFVLIKNTAAGYSWIITDSARGTGQILYANLTTQQTATSTHITSFNSDGFTIGSSADVNNGSDTYLYLAIK